MNLFFVSPFTGTQAILSEEESMHCVRVLRMKAGDEIRLADGQGKFYKARITLPHDKHCEAELLEPPVFIPQRPYSIHLAVAPTKSNDRYEWLLEKITELGCERITPLLCAHSERRRVNTERLQKVLVSAMKQSLQAWQPQLDEAMPFPDFVASVQADQKFICAASSGEDHHLKKLYRPPASVVLLIGPEGDFTEQEMQTAAAAGFIPCSLGPNRLRTETAGLAGCHAIHLLNA